ncbi:autophagy protein [Sarocladium strictum]
MSNNREVPDQAAAAEPRVSGVEPTTGIGDGEPLDNVRSPSPDIDAKIAFTSAETGKAAAGGQAVINQREAIPTTGKRMPTGRWEYISFCIFYFSLNGAPIGNNGGGMRQLLVNMEYPDGSLHWGGQTLPINSMLLNVTGILFASQLTLLLILGPYADYGTWRPWIMIIGQTILYICQFSMTAISKPGQWEAAQALFVIGSLAANIVNAFYAATFPGLVRDLPKLIESEDKVKAGLVSAEEHNKLDAYERSKLYNLVNIVGSGLVAVFYAIAVGITAALGTNRDNAGKVESFRVLMGYFGALTLICTVPFFILQKHRPGLQLPKDTSMVTAGPKQVWMGMKSAKQLKQCLLYLAAYFFLHEAWGTYWSVTGILQNDTINFDPLMLNALSLTTDLCGGSGTLFMLYLQKKFRFSVKSAVFYGACMTIVPQIYGGIGRFTNKFGFHHPWEFWLVSAWNFQTAAWGSYNVTMISEVVPGPKSMLFFALFNCVGKTSGFIGPFISSAIIKADGGNNHTAYWFMLGTALIGIAILWFVDPDQAKIDSAKYLEDEAAELYTEEARAQAKHNLDHTEIELQSTTTKDVKV